MINRILFCTLFSLFACTSCGLIYKQNVQQGNAIEQDDLDELYIGMNRRQVLFVLGTPSIKDPFHHDRWDYVQTFSRRGSDMVQRTVTLRFKDDLLTDISGLANPFASDEERGTSSGGTVASFVKPAAGEQSKPAAPQQKPAQDPHSAAVESAEEEILNPEPVISTIDERNAEDREYQEDRDVLDQTSAGGPDIDG